MNRVLQNAALVFAFASCAVGPKYVRPPTPTTLRYTNEAQPATMTGDGKTQAIASSRPVRAEWWAEFHSAALDTIVKQALANNQTLAAAIATLRQSQDSLRAGYGVFSPDINVGASAGRQQFTPVRFGEAAPAGIFNLFTLQATVSYTLDIWGGQRRAVESLAAQAQAQQEAMFASALTIAGNVVNTVIAEAAYRAQANATNDLIALEKEQVKVADVQARAGTAAYASVLSLVSQLTLTEATLPPLAQRINQSEHLLALLSGQMPDNWKQTPIVLDQLDLPSDLPVVFPSLLVRHRPDILVAEAQLHASNANIGVATAAMLPNLTLSPSVGVNNTSLTNLFANNSLFWNLAAGLTAPLFDGLTLYFQRQASLAAHDASFANYRQTVLTAMSQVADALRALVHDAELAQAQAEAVKAAADALQLTQTNYQAGIATYLQVLTADSQYLQAKLGFIQATAQRLQDTVVLYLSLGGGWWDGGR